MYNKKKVVEEYCWTITQTAGQSCCGRWGSSALEFGLKLESFCMLASSRPYVYSLSICAGPNGTLLLRKTRSVSDIINCAIVTINSQRKFDKMLQCIEILFHIYMKLNMFRATHHPSSGAKISTQFLQWKIQQDATVYQNFTIPYFKWCSTCFGRHITHH